MEVRVGGGRVYCASFLTAAQKIYSKGPPRRGPGRWRCCYPEVMFMNIIPRQELHDQYFLYT